MKTILLFIMASCCIAADEWPRVTIEVDGDIENISKFTIDGTSISSADWRQSLKFSRLYFDGVYENNLKYDDQKNQGKKLSRTVVVIRASASVNMERIKELQVMLVDLNGHDRSFVNIDFQLLKTDKSP